MLTRLCTLLNVKYPIIQGGMQWLATSEIAGSVCNVGALGVIGASSMTPDEFKNNLDRIKKLTSKPFAVNVPIRGKYAETNMKIAMTADVPIVITAAGDPSIYTHQLKKIGIRVIHVVSSAKMAKKAEDEGIDAVIAAGGEAGGIVGPSQISTFVLIRNIASQVNIPVIAAGGIGDAAGFIAALALGAQGIQMGTRFIATTECIAHENYKRAIIKAQDTDTRLIGKSIGFLRVIENEYSMELNRLEEQSAPSEKVKYFTEDWRFRAKRAAIDGDVVNGAIVSGQVAALIDDIISVKEVIDNIVMGSGKIVEKLCSILSEG